MAASDIRAVCLYPSFFDQRRATDPDQRASVVQTRTASMGEKVWLHGLPGSGCLHTLHDLSIGWEGVLEGVVNCLYCLIIVLRSLYTNVGVHNSSQRKEAVPQQLLTDSERTHQGQDLQGQIPCLPFAEKSRRSTSRLKRGLSPSQRDGEEEVQGLRDREGHPSSL